jgi:hypothetical protein
MRIVQLKNAESNFAVAIVKEPILVFIGNFKTVYSLAKYALDHQKSLIDLINENLTDKFINYADVYLGSNNWKLSTPIHHPVDPRFCMLSGTGLTHMASAQNRENMHKAGEKNELTDSMKMYQRGVEGGKPEYGQVGTQPEWFYKGNGSMLKAHNESLIKPNYGNDGGEEPELASVYIIDKNGNPNRIGFVTANEFSDHVMEKKNYLYLAHSKIRHCSIGPELVLTDSITDIKGEVIIKRNNETIWEKEIKTGENNMCHSLKNLEYHHFKYENNRQPYDIHIHFLGTTAFSFGAGIALETGDEMIVKWENMGRALKNKIIIDNSPENSFEIKQL